MEKHSLKNLLITDPVRITSLLRDNQKICYFVKTQEFSGVTLDSSVIRLVPPESLYISHPVSAENLGSKAFRIEYGVRYSYMAGAMAGGIAGEKHVIALGSAGILGTFGAGGLPLSRVESAIITIKQSLLNRLFAVNLIHNTLDRQLEMKTVELFLKHEVTVIEASAFMRLTPAIIFYRAKGLSLGPDGSVVVRNRVIAKVSRQSVALQFMNRAPDSIVKSLLDENRITETEARLLEMVPVADDITVEADSGGHTDNLPLVNILPEMVHTRDTVFAKNRFTRRIRIGAAGGISTPYAAHAAFVMGADYIVTGSINQSCIEASTSSEVKKALARADVPDVTMAPAADMFELGVKVQVLKKGVFYPARASFLYDMYTKCSCIEEMTELDRQKIEQDIFRKSMDSVWNETEEFFRQSAPHILEKAYQEPKVKMALVFRWYLGLSARWAVRGESGREADFQIWCGPSMGAFNSWVKGTYLENPSNRSVVEISHKIMNETAFCQRLSSVKSAGFVL